MIMMRKYTTIYDDRKPYEPRNSMSSNISPPVMKPKTLMTEDVVQADTSEPLKVEYADASDVDDDAVKT